MLPASALISFFNSEISVDLPQPFLPTKPTFWQGLMVADALSSRTLVPRRICNEEKTIIKRRVESMLNCHDHKLNKTYCVLFLVFAKHGNGKTAP